MIRTERIKKLNQKKICKGDYVLYWMQASQRVELNHVLEYAISEANRLNLPVLVYFQLIDNFPEANERHYCFMLQGLREVREKLENMNIRLIVSYAHGNYPDLLSISQNAALVVTDCGYLQFQRQWRREYAGKISCLMVQVESDVVVPVTTASSKEEYSAATIRRKITAKFNDYLVPLNSSTPNLSSLDFRFSSFPLGDIPRALSKLKIDGSVKPSSFYRGGTEAAKKHLQDFLKHKINYFHQLRNDPSKEYVSNLSPYLHFGQISPLFVALKTMQQDTGGTDVFLEELIIRRELAINFVYYNPLYMSFDCLPDWVKKTLQKHKNDPREYLYSPEEFEHAKTHDPYWNAAQKEMVVTGKMHGYMRMYWGKKILEWSKTPEEAYRIALYLNNKYELDGRDPNGYAGVAWCFGKHDRPWAERPIFGNVRYMNANGLKRKFDIEAYVTKVQEMKTNKSFCGGVQGGQFFQKAPPWPPEAKKNTRRVDKMSTKSLKKFYQEVSREEIRNFQQFKETHQRKQLDYNGQRVEFLSCGQGEKTILLPPGGFGILPPEYGFRSIMHFEKNYKVIAPDVSRVRHLDEAIDILNRILDAEGIDMVIVVGGSGGGITAQSYFKRNFARVEAMVLYNTFGPKKERNKRAGLWIIRIFPGFILRPLFMKKLSRLAAAEIPSEAEERVGFNVALLKEMFSTKFNKKAMLSALKLVFEFNERDAYKLEDFKEWKGKVLVITAEDDPYFKDTDDLIKNLPNTELYTFPKGVGHMAPLIHPDKFFGKIDQFLP